MLRRDFLKALAAAALMPSMVAVAAQSPIAIPTSNPHQKYIDALALYDGVIAADQHNFNNKANELFVFLLSNFPSPEMNKATKLQFVTFLNVPPGGESIDKKLRSLPPEIAEILWPVAAIKSLIAEHKLPVMHSRSRAIMAFVDRYKQIIM
jgi:hypothetical protein